MVRGWFPKDILNTIVPIVRSIGKIGARNEVKPHGTGFLVGYKNLFALVTCRHVVVDTTNLGVIINGDETPTFMAIEPFQEKMGLSWLFHPDQKVDLALTFIGLPHNHQHKLTPIGMIERSNIEGLGEEVFYIGFPMGLGLGEQIIPILRRGSISAYMDDGRVLVEGNAFPGSSGSPVWLKPEALTLQPGGIAIGPAPITLVGTVSCMLPYQDGIQEENSALFYIEPSHRLMELFETESCQGQSERLLLKMKSEPGLCLR